MTIIVYGSNGYVGRKLCNIFDRAGLKYVKGNSRLENIQDVYNELNKHKPNNVFNLVDKSDINWCEDNKIEAIRVNVIGTINLIDVCYKKGIHITNYIPSCIYNSINDNFSFKEDDTPNWNQTFYHKTKSIIETISKEYNNTLNLRINSPMCGDLDDPDNFISILLKQNRVADIPSSFTLIEDMLPISINMALNGRIGTYNFTNPGFISPSEILGIYKFYVNKSIEINTFSVEQNCILDTSKIESFYNIPNIRFSIKRLFKKLSVTNGPLRTS